MRTPIGNGVSAIITRALRQAEQSMRELAGDAKHIEAARSKAVAVITRLFDDTPLRITWTNPGR